MAPRAVLRVLLIDDDADGCQALRDVLVGFGHEVTVAHSGADGLAAAPTSADAVICDLGLPDIDGYEVATRLRADPRTALVRLVAISGYRRAAGPAARAAGFDACLVKPISPDRLREALAGPRSRP